MNVSLKYCPTTGKWLLLLYDSEATAAQASPNKHLLSSWETHSDALSARTEYLHGLTILE